MIRKSNGNSLGRSLAISYQFPEQPCAAGVLDDPLEMSMPIKRFQNLSYEVSRRFPLKEIADPEILDFVSRRFPSVPFKSSFDSPFKRSFKRRFESPSKILLKAPV